MTGGVAIKAMASVLTTYRQLRRYHRTGDRALLDQALAGRRRTVDALPADSALLPMALHTLASVLGDQYRATGRADVLAEAITTQRRVISLYEANEAKRPGSKPTTSDGDAARELGRVDRRLQHYDYFEYLSQLAMYLGHQYGRSRDPALLDEAEALERRVLDGTPARSPYRRHRLAGLASTLRQQYERHHDRALLEEAVDIQRRAVEATPAGDVNRPSMIRLLASFLADLADETGDAARRDEAWAMVDGLHTDLPFVQAQLAWTRADLVRRDRRRDDRFAVAAREIAAGVAVVERLRRGEENPGRRRDLAQLFDGLLGDLVASTVRSGDVDRAVELIEADRVWLSAPQRDATEAIPSGTAPVPVAWVASSQWETVVITTTDHRTYSPHLVETSRLAIHRAVATNVNVRRRPAGYADQADQKDVAARLDQAVDDLCALATDIAAVFPREERLLIVPVGLAAQVPYAAARSGDGFLTDHMALTLAPSLAWARAALRPRPDGRSFGAFHPGSGSNALDLDEDRRTFEKWVGGTILDRPTAEEVLAHLDGDADIGHISCHGTYDVVDPFESKLHLETSLTLRAVLEHPEAPWLVNLSACDTAVCDLSAAEQQIALPTALLLAGAAHVIANIWVANAQVAAALDACFYRFLAEGCHPAVARRRAVRAVRDLRIEQTGDDLHPRYWAQCTHFGTPW